MNKLPHTISRLAPIDVGLDYSELVTEGTRLVQVLSGKIWTNFNYSDPGVTILEQLCYALTELSYRADFPVQDLLGTQATGHIALQRQGLYPARAIMPINPVTPNDLRRLVIDQIPEVGNVWFTPLPASETAGVGGLYRIAVLTQPGNCECDTPKSDQDTILASVLDCYSAHRALCEDVHACYILKQIPTRISADVCLADHSDPDTVLAQLLFAVGMTLTPEPKRTSLADQRAAGLTTAEIFQGPLMMRGFIADDQLTPLPRQMAIETILKAMVEVPGVLSVEALTVHVGNDPHAYTVDEVINLPEGCIMQLALAWRPGFDSIRMFYDSVVCSPNPARVRRLLDRAWVYQRRIYPLWAEYSDFYCPPTGQGIDLSAYSSIQNQFPAVYGIGTFGLPSEAGPMRRAQAKQLKGYLMVFDQLMANYFSQLTFVRDLFSIEAGGDKTYAWQSLRGIVPDAKPLLSPGYEAQLAALIAAHDPVIARQTTVLDFLLSLYASTLTAPTPAVNDIQGREAQSASLLKAKQALLARMVPATRDRGRGFDYRRGEHRNNMAGMEIRCRIELALLDTDARHDGIAVADDVDEISFGQLLPDAESALITRSFLPVEIALRDTDIAPNAPHLGIKRVASQLLPALADPARYRVGLLRENGSVSLVCQDMDERWWLLGEFIDVMQAGAMAESLILAASGERERIYIVEWILLRDSMIGDDSNRQDAADDFSFRISAVMPVKQEGDDAQSDGWRRQARAILRDNTPAHIVVEDVFLEHYRMKRFVRLYDEWVHALRHGSRARRAETSRRLMHFLRPSMMLTTSAAMSSHAPSPTANATPAPPSPKAVSAQPAVSMPSLPPLSLPTSAALMPPPPASMPTAVETHPSNSDQAPSSDSATASSFLPENLPLTASAQEKKWWRFWKRVPSPTDVAQAALEPSLASLPGQVQAAPPGASGAYVHAKLNVTTAQAFAATGFAFVIRDLTWKTLDPIGDLNTSEATAILQAGLALMPVQQVPSKGWTPSAELGARDGKRAAAHARWVGFPAGVTIWIHLHEVGAGTALDDVVAYCNAWHDAVAQVGYTPGLYQPANPTLGDADFYSKLQFQRYWRSGGLPNVSSRGSCLIQAIGNAVLDGISYDWNFVEADNMGDTPCWLKAMPQSTRHKFKGKK